MTAAATILAITTSCAEGTSDDSNATTAAEPPELRSALDDAVRQGIPGVQVVITQDGRDRAVTSGAADTTSGRAFALDDRIRIASNTKSFVATVMLQLVGEGKIELDAPVERYLPGFVHGNGYDGHRITVRNLLQHTAGLADYIEPEKMAKSAGNLHRQPFDAATLVGEVLATKPPLAEPGERMIYSNAGYLLAGLVIEQVTGRPIGTEITTRIIQPLELASTYYPEPGETALRGSHAHGYLVIDGQRTDATELDPYGIGGADGAIVSTGADLNRFFTALLGGRLLAPHLLDEMQRTVPADALQPGAQAGLGLMRIPVSCGTEVWGHGGATLGFATRGGVTADGVAVTVTANLLPQPTEAATAMKAAFDAAVCPPEPIPPELARNLDEIVRQGIPGTQVVFTAAGRDRQATAGVADTASGRPFALDDRVRVGSNTKTFVATVVLQLVNEGKIELDAPVARYLPGTLQGNGFDGNRSTVRQLLQHAAGLPDYADEELLRNFDTVRTQQLEAADLVRTVLAKKPPLFEPGTGWQYSNTGYLLAGMLIEKITGQSVGAEIARRIVEPLGLNSTYYPQDGETTIRGPHANGYRDANGTFVDATDMNTSWAGAAGALVSTAADLNRFFIALLDGRLLPRHLLAEMKHTVAGPPDSRMQYGLGLMRREVSCGKEAWGHGGDLEGFTTRSVVTPDGRAVHLTVNLLTMEDQPRAAIDAAFDTAVCSE
ncbi:serine hydrolase domain-containing protein [Nocardia sp. NPDC004278]